MPSHRIVFGLAVVLLTGCQSDRTKPYPVRGTVVLTNGQPATDLAGGLVTFTSSDMKTSSIGEIGPDGTFVLSTEKKGNGAIPGTYEVAVSPPIQEERSERLRKQPQQVPHYVCVQRSIIVEPKTNEVKLTVRQATRGERE
jgi:hypothetical protein